MLREVVSDLDGERVTQEEFEHFSFTWQAVDTLVRERLALRPQQLVETRSSRPAIAKVEGGG
jgi:hypothetical protein